VNTRIAQKQSQLAALAFTMRAPMSRAISLTESAANLATNTTKATMILATSTHSTIVMPAFSAFGFGMNVAVAEAAGATTTYVAGLACTPSAAKKHDRKNNWQQRPLSLCGRSG
jgi:hypothetical protein